MYSAIIFPLSDQSIRLGTPGYSCHPVSSMVVKPLFLGTLWAEGKGPTQENQGKEVSANRKLTDPTSLCSCKNTMFATSYEKSKIQ